MKDEGMLRYLGGGFLPGVPARDLTDDEVAQHGGAERLRATGLYAPGKTQPVENSESEIGIIDLRDGVSPDEATLAGKALHARREK